jgi:glucose-6-phosphate 1-epimerase
VDSLDESCLLHV